MNIGIIGNGFVGSAIAAGFALHANVRIYDTDVERSTHTLHETINMSTIIFVSVPTPTKLDTGKIDLSILDGVLREINRLNDKSDNVVVIKSTVVPGTVERYILDYPKLNIIFSPEFLTERTANLDFINASRIILGGNPKFIDVVEQLFRRRFPYIKIIKTDVATAQFIKYMCNCFFATKISFMNEMKQVSEATGVNWDDAMNGFISDGRIGNSHLDVPGHDGHRGFGGKCFPKDINAFICMMNDAGVDAKVLQAVWDKNMEVRETRDWLNIKGATS